jgi:hypothetical protein
MIDTKTEMNRIDVKSNRLANEERAMLRRSQIGHTRQQATTRWSRRPYALAGLTGFARGDAGRLPVAECGENPEGRAPYP